MNRYKMDLRVGCVAIIDTTISPDSPGLHFDSSQVIKYWHGVNMKDKLIGNPYFWHIPNYIIRRAVRTCYKLNN